MSDDTITIEVLTELTRELAERLGMAKFEPPINLGHIESIGQFTSVSYVFSQAAAALRLSAQNGASRDSMAVRTLAQHALERRVLTEDQRTAVMRDTDAGRRRRVLGANAVTEAAHRAVRSLNRAWGELSSALSCEAQRRQEQLPCNREILAGFAKDHRRHASEEESRVRLYITTEHIVETPEITAYLNAS